MNATMAGRSARRWAARGWIAWVLGTLAAAAQAAGVAMVTDLTGKAVASSAGRGGDITILAEIQPGAKVDLAAGATLVTLYLDSGDEYAFKGPATIEFRPGQPEVLTGAKPERRSLELGKGAKPVRIKPVGMTQGAMVMRGIRPDARIQLVSLNRARTLDAEPAFVWTGAAAGAEIRIRAARSNGSRRLRIRSCGNVAQASRHRSPGRGDALHVGSVDPSSRWPQVLELRGIRGGHHGFARRGRRVAPRGVRAAVDANRVCRVARPDGTQGRSAQILEGRGGGAAGGLASQDARGTLSATSGRARGPRHA